MSDPIQSMDYLKPNRLAVATSTNITLFDTDSWSALHIIKNCHQKSITNVVFSKDGSDVLSSSLDGHIKVWKLSDFSHSHTFTLSEPIINLTLYVLIYLHF